MKNIITVHDLTKDYGKNRALDGISFALRKGETLALLGPNGAGKTTAIHILLGLLAPTSGEVRLFGLDPMKERYRIAERINFSSADTHLPSNLKVKENLRIYTGIYNIPHPASRMETLLKEFQMDHLKNRVTGSLSTGERTRLNLVKCLLNDPEVLLLDEPTASLDPDIADTVRQKLKKIQKERDLAMIYTSHNMNEIEEVADRVLFIHQGKAIAEGRPAEIMKNFQSESLDEVFIKIARGG